MITREHLWAIVLPATDRADTDGFSPQVSNSQAWLRRQRFATAFERAQAAVYRNRICVVAHARQLTLGDLPEEIPRENLFVQPSDCGSAISILLSLLHITFRDPDARLLILPGNDAADDECTLTIEIKQVLHKLKSKPGIVLLGVRPDAVVPDFDYLAMGAHDHHRLFSLEQLIRSPSLLDAQALVDTGALWHTSIIAANANVLLDLFMLRMPDLVTDMQIAVIRDELTPNGPLGTRHLYWRLPRVDFVNDILMGAEHFLRVSPVPACGWRMQTSATADQEATLERFGLQANSRY